MQILQADNFFRGHDLGLYLHQPRVQIFSLDCGPIYLFLLHRQLTLQLGNTLIQFRIFFLDQFRWRGADSGSIVIGADHTKLSLLSGRLIRCSLVRGNQRFYIDLGKFLILSIDFGKRFTGINGLNFRQRRHA